MIPFSLRIFVSAWAIVVITSALTLWTARWLPEPAAKAGDATLVEEVLVLLAQDLRRHLATDPATGATHFTRERRLDFGPLLQVYVLDPEGQDVLGRTLPAAVERVSGLRGNSPGEAPEELFSPRVHIQDQDLGGFRIVGHEGLFPVARELLRPGARGLLILFALVVSAAASLMLARYVVRPVRRLQLAGQKVAAGDLSVRVSPTLGGRTDEIATLARDFDAMTRKVEELLQSRHRLMRDVSHELRSPLARLQALLSIARQKGSGAGAEMIDRMEAELEHLDQLIGEILAYSRLEATDDVSRTPTDLVDLVQNIVDDASVEAEASGKRLRMHGPERCVIDINGGLIQSAVENVVRNALRHTAVGTAVDVSVVVVEEAFSVRITIDDHGPGIPPDAIGKIFEPFFRVEDARSTMSGSGGIGLAIADRSIRLHGGTISACNLDRGGLRIDIVLPRQVEQWPHPG